MEKRFDIILELERLREYHVIFKLEYRNCTLQNLPYYLKQQVIFHADIEYASEFENHYKILSDAYRLEDNHIANMLGIIKVYIENSDPSDAEELSHLNKKFLEVVSRLSNLSELNKKSAIRFLIDSTNQFSNTNGFEILNKDENVEIVNFLKASSLEKLHSLKSSFQAFSGENNMEITEVYIDVAISLAKGVKNISPELETFDLLKNELNKLISKNNFNKTKYKNDLLRMIYKTLLEYLNNETSIKPEGEIDGIPKETAVEQYRIIYQLCYCFGLVERIEDKTKQYEKVKNILKNFKEDNRPSITNIFGSGI
ncbi:hypothetical protein EZ449_20715 [Pedobacter frigidisoli]|uniref:Uncharacterized protein n=1 Tax=Pedobacter frigidisoli TaxID=2530455 RepID=A0A4R0NIW1_9SPHI|nr:hypothetical protein [Pedobacter frigidisoli]TCD00581.1 hypothetical protein EZ449_20715 [Pedobacter frigidisoli]